MGVPQSLHLHMFEILDNKIFRTRGVEGGLVCRALEFSLITFNQVNLKELLPDKIWNKLYLESVERK